MAERADIHLLGLPGGGCSIDLGMRIDLVLASATVADRVRAVWSTGRPARAAGRAITPVIVDLDEAPDGEIGPVAAALRPGGQARSAKLPQSP